MKEALDILKVVAGRNRVRILAALREHRELCACEITEMLQVKGATASRHLSRMVGAGLLQSRKEGRWVIFRMTDDREKRRKLASLLRWIEKQTADDSQVRKDRSRLVEILELGREEICRRQRGEECCPR